MSISDPHLATIAEKTRRRERLCETDGLAILRTGDMQGLRELADAAARDRHGDIVYYSTNRHVNYSNVCELRCSFCRFSREVGQTGAYEMSLEEIVQAVDPGVRELHLVGSLHPTWPFEHYVEMVQAVRRKRPEIGIKGFTAVEILHFSHLSGLSVEAVLDGLKEAGLNSLPGGGAEVFSPRVRNLLCPKKPSSQEWLRVHETAHRLGLPTNATILYGHIETPEERVAHLEALRRLQDKTGGFLCFVPLPFQPGGAGEPPEWQRGLNPSDPCDDLRMIALSRLYLDNVPHIKAYWVMLGLETTIMSLCYGADDIDGTVRGEKIAHAAGAATPQQIDREMIGFMTRQVGKRAVERDSLYRIVAHA